LSLSIRRVARLDSASREPLGARWRLEPTGDEVGVEVVERPARQLWLGGQQTLEVSHDLEASLHKRAASRSGWPASLDDQGRGSATACPDRKRKLRANAFGRGLMSEAAVRDLGERGSDLTTT
jgi:hypothetical protein